MVSGVQPGITLTSLADRKATSSARAPIRGKLCCGCDSFMSSAAHRACESQTSLSKTGHTGADLMSTAGDRVPGELHDLHDCFTKYKVAVESKQGHNGLTL